MVDKVTSKLGRMGRRRFLSTLSMLGVSGTTLRFITKDALGKVTEDIENEVPYVQRLRHKTKPTSEGPPERKPVFSTISRDRWVEVESTLDAAQRLNDRFNYMANSDLITPTVSWVKKGHHTKRGVVVRYKTEVKKVVEEGEVKEIKRTPDISLKELRGHIPATVSGKAGTGDTPDSWTRDNIPVVIEEETQVDAGSCKKFYYDSLYDEDIPAGCLHECGGVKGTLGTPAYNNSDDANEYQMFTAGHITQSGNDMYQPEYDADIDGTVYESVDSTNVDYGLYQPMGTDENYMYRLADDSGGYKTDTYITGIITWDAIKNADSSETFYHQGARTGTSSGSVVDYWVSSDGDKCFKIDAESYEGDSGGPIYQKHFENNEMHVYIAGIYVWYYPGSDDTCSAPKSGGNAMEYLENVSNTQV